MRTIRMLGLWAMAIGLWLMLAPPFLYAAGTWQNLINDLCVGTLIAGAGLWRAYGERGARWATAIIAVLGLLQFLSPWLYGQTLESARWNAWICGILLMGIAGILWAYHPEDLPLHFTLFPDIFASSENKASSWTIATQRREQKRLNKLDRQKRRSRTG